MPITRPTKNAIIYCVIFAFIYNFLATDFFKSLEISAYDTHMRSSEILTHPDIVLISIDDKSIEKIDAWPFSRDLSAKVIDYINSAQPSLIATTDIMAQQQKDMGADYLDRLQAKVKELDKDSELLAIQAEIDSALNIINTDQTLANAIEQTSNYIAPIALLPSNNPVNPDRLKKAIEEYSFNDLRNNTAKANEQNYRVRSANEILHSKIKNWGHINKQLDKDEILRHERYLWPIDNKLIPSLAFKIYLHHENLLKISETGYEVSISPDNKLNLNDTRMDFPKDGKINTRFYSGNKNALFKNYSFYDVFTESIPAQEFSNKAVIIGTTAAGVGSRYKVSSGQNLSSVEILAHTSSSLLNDDWIKRTDKQRAVEILVYCLIALYLIFLFPKYKILTNILISASICLSLMVFEFGSLEFSYWYKFVSPVFFLLLGLFSLSFATLRSKEAHQDRLTKEKDETNLQLGLAFQNQGALDLAFEKYLSCEAGESLVSPLYNLGLEYERKRQFAKASSVYEYLDKISPNHLDVSQRIQQSKSLGANSTQQMFGQESKLASLLQAGGSLEKPRLGRYEIEREIGRGAMSIVYAGRDPSINRTVAIKVQSFSGDDQAQLKKMRERFLTEAKTAGQLNHPNIITIYDIGEEIDLIYIAMEYLEGNSLEAHLKDGKPSDEILLDICIRIAWALDYAHRHTVIHRDIKPSNIIYQAETRQVHLTDFGIARMQDTNLTQTGQVVGTPSYMSPEQITGKRVDYRSDLFSFGVTMYQLFTENLPFQADTLATLLYKITMEAPIPFDALRPELPPQLTIIINKLIKKEADERYQSAEALAKDLEDCKNSIKNTL